MSPKRIYVVWYDANFKRKIKAENIIEAAEIARAKDKEREFYIVPLSDWREHKKRIAVLTKSGERGPERKWDKGFEEIREGVRAPYSRAREVGIRW